MRFVLPAAKKFVNQIVIPIRWGDLDLMGHVNNTVYFKYLEVARLDWLYKIGAPPNPNGSGPVIVNAFCNFTVQLEFPGDIVAKHYVANPGRSSFDTYITLARCEAPDLICAEGGSKTVWTDGLTKKSAPMPDWLRALIS